MSVLGLLTCMATAAPLGAVASEVAELDPHATLPCHIPIKTPTQTFNHLYYFALHDGLIYYRLNPETTGVEETWRLLGDTGLPTDPRRRFAFDEPAEITEIHADAAALGALSSDNRFYYLQLYQDSPRGRYGPGWWDVWGFPWPGDLVVEDEDEQLKGWAIGRRAEDVLYYEDPDGNPHHYGTMGITTLYVLAADGTHLHYTDSGLPPSLGRTLCGPDRGRFRAEAVSASASTLMVIDADGRIYTRLADFDTIGADAILYPYTYSGQTRPNERPEDPRSRFRPWSLPPEPWRLQPPIPLVSGARISADITIRQTGRGNAARELRVAGLNPQGEAGYYYKPIFAEHWAFEVSSDIPLPLTPLGEPQAQSTAIKLTSPIDGHYQGRLSLGKHGAWPAELIDFNLFCSPATLRLHPPGGPVDINLHTVEAWNPRARRAPGFDGGPRVYLGTLELPPVMLGEEQADASPLSQALWPLHQDTFALTIFAQPSQVVIERARGMGTFALSLSRVDVSEGLLAQADGANPFSRRVPDAAPPPFSAEAAKAQIATDKRLLTQLDAELDAHRYELLRHRVSATTLSLGGAVLKGSGVFLLPPPVGTIARWSGPIGRAQARAEKARLTTLAADYALAKHTLETRITAHEALLEAWGDDDQQASPAGAQPPKPMPSAKPSAPVGKRSGSASTQLN